MIEWYALVVGTRPNFRNEGIAFITNDAANHRLALLMAPGLEVDPHKLRHDGMHHTAFEFESLDDLLGTYLRLKRHDVVPHMCLDHGLTMSFYYVDPDGNSVELQADNYGDWEQSSEFIRDDPRFAADPIGKFVDPDGIVELRQSGVDPRQVHERAYRGECPARGPVDMRLPR